MSGDGFRKVAKHRQLSMIVRDRFTDLVKDWEAITCYDVGKGVPWGMRWVQSKIGPRKDMFNMICMKADFQYKRRRPQGYFASRQHGTVPGRPWRANMMGQAAELDMLMKTCSVEELNNFDSVFMTLRRMRDIPFVLTLFLDYMAWIMTLKGEIIFRQDPLLHTVFQIVCHFVAKVYDWQQMAYERARERVLKARVTDEEETMNNFEKTSKFAEDVVDNERLKMLDFSHVYVQCVAVTANVVEVASMMGLLILRTDVLRNQKVMDTLELPPITDLSFRIYLIGFYMNQVHKRHETALMKLDERSAALAEKYTWAGQLSAAGDAFGKASQKLLHLKESLLTSLTSEDLTKKAAAEIISSKLGELKLFAGVCQGKWDLLAHALEDIVQSEVQARLAQPHPLAEKVQDSTTVLTVHEPETVNEGEKPAAEMIVHEPPEGDAVADEEFEFVNRDEFLESEGNLGETSSPPGDSDVRDQSMSYKKLLNQQLMEELGEKLEPVRQKMNEREEKARKKLCKAKGMKEPEQAGDVEDNHHDVEDNHRDVEDEHRDVEDNRENAHDYPAADNPPLFPSRADFGGGDFRSELSRALERLSVGKEDIITDDDDTLENNEI